MNYIVKQGDTLTAIAKKHDTTVEALVASNGIKNKDRIYVGQIIMIPAKEPSKPLGNNQVYNALVTCLDAIENLPEFKQLEALLNG
jgi:LysM repeat protein